MWWWNARGYTSAGVEAWNCIRALDYLQSRPEVDAERIGVTGRSGGGAYSWWIAALDDRIKVAVPVAGITSLKNHVVDGCVEGHCDCMYQVNTYRWDYPQVAALVAPRPLLISNSDKDGIFPLDGVVDVYTKVRRIYELHGALGNIGLQITEGPHKDTQELRIHAFHWFNRFLKGEDPLIETAAVKQFEPEALKVFESIPEDELNTSIQESFTVKATAASIPDSQATWEKQKSEWLTALEQKSFRSWPQHESNSTLDVQPVFSADRDGIHLEAHDFTSQQQVQLRLYVAYRAGLKPRDLDLIVLNALDEQSWSEFLATMQVGFAEELKDEQLPPSYRESFDSLRGMFKNFKWGMAYVAPRGIGPTLWNRDPRKQVQIRRRFMLLGQTLDGMRVWDIRRAAETLRTLDGMRDVSLWMQGERHSAGLVLYASLFVPDVDRLDLWNLSRSHRDGPIFLNVLRYLDVPQTVAMAAEGSRVRIFQDETTGWEYSQAVADALNWDAKQIQVRKIPAAEPKPEK